MKNHHIVVSQVMNSPQKTEQQIRKECQKLVEDIIF